MLARIFRDLSKEYRKEKNRDEYHAKQLHGEMQVHGILDHTDLGQSGAARHTARELAQ